MCRTTYRPKILLRFFRTHAKHSDELDFSSQCIYLRYLFNSFNSVKFL